MTIYWSAFSFGRSLLSIENEALVTIYSNVICIYNLKTGEMRYVAADSPENGRRIECITIHNNMPLIAFAEAIIRPSVFILQYPSMTKYTVFPTTDIVRIEDLKFNEYDLLFAISGYPSYTIVVWNFRTGQQVLQYDTTIYSVWGSLKLSNHQMPQIAQYSHWFKEIVVWEMSCDDDVVEAHEVSRIKLKSEDGANLSPFAVCYTNDNHLYYVDIYGIVYSVELTSFNLKKQWSLFGDSSLQDKVSEDYGIFAYKQGLLVLSSKICYYICPKVKIWTTEWRVSIQSMDICCLAPTSNGGIYAASTIGNLFHIELFEDKQTVVKTIYNFNALGDHFLVLNGIKEECIIHLLRNNHIRALEPLHGRLYSTLFIKDASAMKEHEQLPWLVVGTTTGILNVINYEQLRTPEILSTLQSDSDISVQSLDFLDHTILYHDNYLTFYLIHVDLVTGSMTRIGRVIQLSKPITLVGFYLGENNCAMLFLEQEAISNELPIPMAKELWSYQWKTNSNVSTNYIINLPNVYRDLAKSPLHQKNIEEYYAVRIFSNIIDYLRFYTETNELHFLQSFRSHHYCHVNGITISRNITTWGVDACYTHMRFHKKAPGQVYAISQCMHVRYRAFMIDKAMECYNYKYLISLWGGRIKIYGLNKSQYPLQENIDLHVEEQIIKPSKIKTEHWEIYKEDVVIEHTAAEWNARASIIHRIEELSKEVTALIDYDISVTGKAKGVFRKFCMNSNWLEELTTEAQTLCELERKSITDCIEERCRIRDWLRNLILKFTVDISYNVRTLFSNFSAENYGIPKNTTLSREYDQYRFCDMEPPNDNVDDDDTESTKIAKVNENIQNEESEDEDKDNAVVPIKKKRNFLYVDGPSVYDHVMSDSLALQSINVITAHQMHNQQQKYKPHLVYALRYEYNKKFDEVYQLKKNLMESIAKANDNLRNIFKNMNCMLCLLNLEKYNPAELTIAQWEKNEVITRIMDVDDSEIKAINRRKKKIQEAEKKKGRLLLWSIDFWVKALVVMMDGVLEKLWEEEIKKDIPLPEFMLKKEVAEYTLEDQKMLRDYEEKVRRLAEDRNKYLRILGENEKKTLEQKTQYIKRINEQVTSLMIVKLKYDHAIKHVQLRSLSTKMTYSKRLKAKQYMRDIRNNIDRYDDCITQYTNLSQYWEKNLHTLHSKLEIVESREKAQERYFKNQYINLLPAPVVKEMVRAYRKRIKIAPKILSSQMMCKILAQRVVQKTVSPLPFPLPPEVYEYLDALKILDHASNMPQNVEPRLWEQMVKLRRQKIETELKLRSLHIQVSAAQFIFNNYEVQLSILNEIKEDTLHHLEEMKKDYFIIVQDQPLTVRLYLGQVETNLLESFRGLENCILMNQDDIIDVNDMILSAGQFKMKMMQKVAKFRRQVIYTEWEHKSMMATISHLKFMLNVLQKCKVSLEFLDIIRNWKKVKSRKEHMVNTVGLIEKVREDKISGFRENLNRLNATLDKLRQQINKMKHSNQKLNCEIDEVKVNVSLVSNQRDVLLEKKRIIEQQEKMEKIKKHAALINVVRKDHAKIMELRMILQLTRMRTIPMLGPNIDQCEK